MGLPVLLFVYFRLFKQTLRLLQQKMWKIAHLVHSGGIGTHDLRNMRLIPLQLDQEPAL